MLAVDKEDVLFVVITKRQAEIKAIKAIKVAERTKEQTIKYKQLKQQVELLKHAYALHMAGMI